MRRIRLSFAILFFVLGIAFSFSLNASASTDGIISSKYEDKAQAIYLYSYDAKSVLYSVGVENSLKPASTAKIMMGLIACEKLESRLDEKIVITKEMLEGHVGTTMGLKSGMTVSVTDLLYGAICGCNNDATQVIAFICSGSIEKFVLEMNERATKLNMASTVYANPTGLDAPSARTTASNVALLSHKASQNDLYMQICSAKKFTVHLDNKETVIYNRNALISHFTSDKYLNSNISGLNAGSTDEGGYVVSAMATVDGCKYLCIVLGAETNNGEIYSYKIVNELLETVNKSYERIQLFSKDEPLSKLDVRFALDTKDNTQISCVLRDDVYAFLPSNLDAKNDLKYSVFLHDDVLNAPIEDGMVVGGVNVYYKGSFVATGTLVSYQSIQENSFLTGMSSMKEFLLSRYFLIFVFLLIIGFLAFLCYDRKHQRRRKVGYISYKNFFKK